MLIVGGGVAGVEALLALHDMAGARAAVTLVAPEPDFLYKPLLVEEPFSADPPEQRALEPLAEEMGAEFVLGAVQSVDAEGHQVVLADGSKRDYEYLLVATGGRFRPAFDGVRTFPSPKEPLGPEVLLTRAHVTGDHTIAFIVPPGVSWPLPLYEIALMTERRAREGGFRDVKLRFVTHEPEPLGVFGEAASAALRELLAARGIELLTDTHVDQENGEIVLRPGGARLEAAEVVALPAMDGPGLAGLPADEHGFIPIDEHARVLGTEDVYAAGDGTNFPIKQGGLGTQQADAAAGDIAHRLGAAVDPEPFRPVLRGKLLTGAESIHMQADVAGGGGEGEVSPDCLWWPPQKISGRYLAPWLYHSEARADPEPPGHALDVEVALPKEWQEQPMIDPRELS